jgi:hypothetical protein
LFLQEEEAEVVEEKILVHIAELVVAVLAY